MERPASQHRPDFDLQPARACAWLANQMANSRSSSEILDYLLYQYSSESSFTLLDEHLEGVVQAVMDLPAPQYQAAWYCLFDWMSESCPNRLSGLFAASTRLAIQAQNNDWLTLRWEDMSQSIRFQQIKELPQDLEKHDVLLALFPIGHLLIESLPSLRANQKRQRREMLELIDKFVGWAGNNFVSALDPEHVIIISKQAHQMNFDGIPHLRALLLRHALTQQSLSASTPGRDVPATPGL